MEGPDRIRRQGQQEILGDRASAKLIAETQHYAEPIRSNDLGSFALVIPHNSGDPELSEGSVQPASNLAAPTGAISTPIAKGIRQPQSLKLDLDSANASKRPISPLARAPRF